MRQFIKDNWEEFICGFVLGIGFFYILSYWCLLCGLICGVLWRLGGSGWLGTKLWRRVGVPIAIALAFQSLSIPLKVVSIVISAVVLLIGYGTRGLQPPDPGSPLGNFWLDRLGEKWGSVASRATIIIAIWITWGVAYGLATK